MTSPREAMKALERAVDNQRAQREAAQESRRVEIPAEEFGIETPDTDREPTQ